MTERNERGQTTVTSTAAATILPDAPVEKSQWRITHYFAIDSPSRRAYPPPRFRLPCGNNSSAPSSFSSARVSFFPSALPAAPFPNLDQWRRPPLEGGIRERGHAAVPRGLLRVHKGHPSFGETQSSTETNRVVNHPPRCFLAPGFSLAFPPALPPLFWRSRTESRPFASIRTIVTAHSGLRRGETRAPRFVPAGTAEFTSTTLASIGGTQRGTSGDIRSAWRQIFLKFINLATPTMPRD